MNEPKNIHLKPPECTDPLPNLGYVRCQLPRGHEGSHECVLTRQRSLGGRCHIMVQWLEVEDGDTFSEGSTA